MSLFVVKDSRVGVKSQTYPYKIRNAVNPKAKIAWECDSYEDAVDWVQQMQDRWFMMHPQQEMSYLLARPYISDLEFSINMWRFIRAKFRAGFKGNIDALKWRYINIVAVGRKRMMCDCYFCHKYLGDCKPCPMVSCNKGGTLWFRVWKHDVEACTKIINLLRKEFNNEV